MRRPAPSRRSHHVPWRLAMADEPIAPEAPDGPEEPPRTFTFPTAYTVLALVLLLVWIASFFVPAGVYKTDKTGAPKPGTYHKLPSCSEPVATAPSLDTSS